MRERARHLIHSFTHSFHGAHCAHFLFLLSPALPIPGHTFVLTVHFVFFLPGHTFVYYRPFVTRTHFRVLPSFLFLSPFLFPCRKLGMSGRRLVGEPSSYAS